MTPDDLDEMNKHDWHEVEDGVTIQHGESFTLIMIREGSSGFVSKSIGNILRLWAGLRKKDPNKYIKDEDEV